MKAAAYEEHEDAPMLWSDLSDDERTILLTVRLEADRIASKALDKGGGSAEYVRRAVLRAAKNIAEETEGPFYAAVAHSLAESVRRILAETRRGRAINKRRKTKIEPASLIPRGV